MANETQVPVKQAGALTPHPIQTVFGSLQREIDRLFDDFVPSFAPAGATEVRCRMDLAETQNGLELSVELPGLEEKDIDVSVSDGILTVCGEKKFETERKDKNYRFIERSYGSFRRAVELPAGAKPDQIKATMNKGVLTVTIPVPAKPEAQKIPVTGVH